MRIFLTLNLAFFCNSPIFKSFAVNSELSLASNTGKKILEKGGNAVDAAIATALVVGVVNSFSSGIGGGGFMLIKGPGNIIDSFDFREAAPKNIKPEMFNDKKSAIPLSQVSGLSVAIPGEILGFYEAHKEYGKLPWHILFEDSIKIAKKFKVTKILYKKLERNRDLIQKDKGLKETFTKNNEVIKEGDFVKRANLSKTLEEISINPLSFYNGEIANKIVNFINSKGGVCTTQDLKEYQVKKRDVLKGQFYNFQVYTTNIPTSGIFIIEALKLLERINIRDLSIISNNDNTYYLYHILIEVFKIISIDRNKFGDPDFINDWKKLVSILISDLNITKYFNEFNMKSIIDNKVYYKEDHGTTHLNVIDKDGMIVSLTSTINLEFGSKLLDPETGILFNNEIDDFYIPGIDNAYGLKEMKANIIEGGKRPFSSAAPTILEREGEVLVLGASGGTRIITAIITTIVYFLTGNTLENSIRFCRIHNQLFPEKTFVENSLPENIINQLKSMGHKIEYSEMNTSFTSVQGIYIKDSKEGRVIEAISDERKCGRSSGL